MATKFISVCPPGPKANKISKALKSKDLYIIKIKIAHNIIKIAKCPKVAKNVFDIVWSGDYTYGDVFKQNEFEQSTYNFELADTKMLFDLFDKYEKEAMRVIETGNIRPAYDYVLKCSHTFNLLDSRGAISVSERTAFIGRVRAMARLCAAAYVEQREKLGFPLLKGDK